MILLNRAGERRRNWMRFRVSLLKLDAGYYRSSRAVAAPLLSFARRT
jgi:hypothetical protein